MKKPKVLRTKFKLHRLSEILLIAATCLISQSAVAQMTDIIHLHNGDRITGAVSVMNLGEMRVETRSMGFVDIKWEDIEGIETSKTLQFETARGERIFGTVRNVGDGMIAVQTTTGEKLLNRDEVVYFSRIKADRSVWEAMDKNLRIGFSFTRASDVLRWNIGAGVLYKALGYRTEFRLDSLVTNNGQGADSRRAIMSANYQRFMRNRYFWFGSGSAQTNDELGIDKRFLVSGGAGRYVYQSRSAELMLAFGLAGNLENSTGNTTNASTHETNLEGLMEIDWTFFKLHSPSSRVKTSLEYFPGITDSGRHRVNLNVNLRQEFIKDLFWNIEMYGSYDNRPPTGAISSEDYGIVTSLEYLW
jgi:hypothetical protein